MAKKHYGYIVTSVDGGVGRWPIHIKAKTFLKAVIVYKRMTGASKVKVRKATKCGVWT